MVLHIILHITSLSNAPSVIAQDKISDWIPIWWYYADNPDPVQIPQYVSNQDLHCLLIGIPVQNIVKVKNPPETPQTRDVLIQIIWMYKSAGQKTG